VILIFSAVITPTGDPISLFIFTLPMYLLIEIMIFIHKKSNRGF
jgi:Sec-independent protein secretion pathway component TatC